MTLQKESEAYATEVKALGLNVSIVKYDINFKYKKKFDEKLKTTYLSISQKNELSKKFLKPLNRLIEIKDLQNYFKENRHLKIPKTSNYIENLENGIHAITESKEVSYEKLDTLIELSSNYADVLFEELQKDVKSGKRGHEKWIHNMINVWPKEC